jgi:hypothetical protein
LPAGSGPSTCPTVADPLRGSIVVWVVEERSFRWWVWSVAHYWVLRQQAPSPWWGWGCCVWVPGVLPVVVSPCGGAATSVQGVRVVV